MGVNMQEVEIEYINEEEVINSEELESSTNEVEEEVLHEVITYEADYSSIIEHLENIESVLNIILVIVLLFSLLKFVRS